MKNEKQMVILASVSAIILGFSIFLFSNMRDTDCQQSSNTDSQQGSNAVTGHLFKNKRHRFYKNQLRFKHLNEQYAELKTTAVSSIRSQKWAVCTTIHRVSEAVMFFVNRPDWAIVIVGDQEMDEEINIVGNNTVFLSADDQVNQFAHYQRFLKLLPWKHFGRKNIGFLYAIMHGAELVWDFDDDNYLKSGQAPAVPENIVEIYVHRCPAFNPLPIMGGEIASFAPMWPRGFPLNSIKTKCTYTEIVGGDSSKIAVFQSLADNEPDVDAIYRLTRKTPFTFDKSQQSTFQISRGSMVPYNAQATLVTKLGLWSLLLPVTVHGRVSDIWRSYISQRLFWDAGLTIAFMPPLVNQFRNAHNALADMQAEQDLYLKASELIKHLNEWKSSCSHFPGRAEELMISLYEHGYVDETDVALYQEWLSILLSLGYVFPSVQNSTFRSFQRPFPAESALLTAESTMPYSLPAELTSVSNSTIPESVVMPSASIIDTPLPEYSTRIESLSKGYISPVHVIHSRYSPVSEAAKALGPWAPFFDPGLMPLSWGNARSQQIILSHEMNFDFGEMLYVWENWLIFVDVVGPVCLKNALFAAIKGTAAIDDGGELFMIEIDGEPFLEKSVSSIFYSGTPDLPRPLTRSTLPNRVEGGWYMHCSLCALKRLRVGMRWMNTAASMIEIMQQSDLCVSSLQKKIQCPAGTLYYNAHVMQYPGPDLPEHWTMPSPNAMPFRLEDVNGLGIFGDSRASTLDEALDPRMLIKGILQSAEGYETGRVGASRLLNLSISLDEISPKATILEGYGPGTIKLLLINSEDGASLGRRHVLHHSDLRLQAWWDGGVSINGVWPEDKSNFKCSDTTSTSPSIDIPFTSIWGPKKLFDHELPVLASYYLGETAEFGLHLAFPMPYWMSACLKIVYTGPPNRETGSIKLKVKVVVNPFIEYDSDGSAGYFFVQLMTVKLGNYHYSPNYVINVTGIRGSFVGVLHSVVSERLFFMEGDIVVWVDGNPSPVLWASGYEDFFDASHGWYVGDYFAPFHYVSKVVSGDTNRIFAAKHFINNAIPFRDSLMMCIEGEGFLDNDFNPYPKPPDTFVESAALIYGWPSAGLHLSDMIFTADILNKDNPHGYKVHHPRHPQSDDVNSERFTFENYSLSSYFPSFGFEKSEHPNTGRIPSEIFLTVKEVLAFTSDVKITFTVAIKPDNVGVILRRLTDLRRSASIAAVFIDGSFVGTWINSDRGWSHLDSRWQAQEMIVDARYTAGKSSLQVELRAGPDPLKNKTSYDFMLQPAWVEARWWIISILPPLTIFN